MSSPEPMLSKYFHSKGSKLGLPVAANFELTPRCNFNCKMCYIHLSGEEADRRGRELTADEWLGIAEAARRRGLIFMLLTGGEPLIRPDFEYIYSELRKMGIMVSVNSNGSLIDSDRIDFFRKDPPMRINVSLYGTSEETYERLCGVRQYGKVISNIKAMKEASLPVKLNVLLGPNNVDDVDGIYRVSDELGIPIKPTSYLFPPLRVDGESVGENAARFSPEVAARYEIECDRRRFTHETFVKRCAAICRGIRVEQPDEECDGVPSEGITCRAGRSSFWMTWDGRMMPCGMMTEPVTYPMKVGFDAAWEELKAATAKIFMPPECKCCSVRHACHLCAASAYPETGRFDGTPRYLCKMVRELTGLYKEEYDMLEKTGKIEKYASEVVSK